MTLPHQGQMMRGFNKPPTVEVTDFRNKIGTSRTSRGVRLESAKWVKADVGQVGVADRDFMSTRASNLLI
jgi:hypothetical protein